MERATRASTATSAFEMDRNPVVKYLCPQRVLVATYLSLSQRQRIQKIIDGNFSNLVVGFFTLVSLFANDVDVIVNQGYSSNELLSATLQLSFIVFLFDILARTTIEPRYVFSFYFWLDLVSTVSLGVELVLESVAYEDLLLARTVRATRAGAKLPRLIRLLKLVRMLRILKLWQTVSRRLKGELPSHVAYGVDNDDANEEADESPFAITENLAVILSRKVVLSVLLVIFLFNFVEPIREDKGVLLGLNMIHEVGLKGYEVTEMNLAYEKTYQDELLETNFLIGTQERKRVSPSQSMDDIDKSSNLCAFKLDGTDSSTSSTSITTSDNRVLDYVKTCESKVSARFDFSAALTEDAYIGILQTSLMVVFVLGWSYSLQKDIQFYLVSPLMMIPYGADKRRSTFTPYIPEDEISEEPRHSRPPSSARDPEDRSAIGTAALVRAATKRRLRGSVLAPSMETLEEGSSSVIVMIVGCIRNIRANFVNDPELQKAIDTVLNLMIHKTDWCSTVYSPIVSNKVDRMDFRLCSLEVKRWVYSEVLNVSSSNILVLNDAACKKLGVDMIDDVAHKKTKTQSAAAGDFNFKLAAMSQDGSEYNKLFKESLEELDKQSRKLESRDLDIFDIKIITDNRPLSWLFYAVHRKHEMFRSFKLNEKKMLAFLAIIESGAWCSNPFHNNVHAADTLQTVHWYLTQCRVEDRVTKLEALALFFACATMNYQHTGRTNSFEVETHSDLAICFGDDSILERYTLASAFGVLNHYLANFLEKLEPLEWKTFRKLVSRLVISRDPAMHENVLEKMKVSLQPYDVTRQKQNLPPEEAREGVLIMTLKAASLDYFVKPKELHLQWTERLFTELFEMGDAEKDHNIPISPFCNRDTTNVGHATVAMMEFVVLPFFKIYTQMIPTELRQDITNGIECNYLIWKKRKNKEQAKATSPGVIVKLGRRLSGSAKFKSQKVTPLKNLVPPKIESFGSTLKAKESFSTVNEEETIEQFRNSTRYSARRTQSLVNLHMPEEDIKEIEKLQENLVNVRPFNLQHQASSVAILRAQKIDQVLDDAVRKGPSRGSR